MGLRRRSLAVLVAGSVLLAGCGGDDKGKDSADAPARTTSTTEAATTTTKPKAPTAEPATVKVTMGDDSCDVPAEIAAGPTRFTATNSGSSPRGLVLAALDDGQTVAELVARYAEDPKATLAANRFGAGPNAVPADGSGAVQLDLEAGSYAAICAVPGATEPPAAGLVRPLTVEAAAAAEGSALPSGPTITVTDKAIVAPLGFAGTGLVRVENTGGTAHEVAIYRVAMDTTVDEAVAWLTAAEKPAGPAKATPVGGVTALSPGQEAAVDLDLPGGIYLLASFLPGAGGKDDVARGLVAPLIVP